MVATLDDVDLSDTTVLVRVDFNVPLKEGKVMDDTRIRAALPTIHRLREQGCRIILCSHLGRPEGSFDAKLSLRPVADYLASLIDDKTEFVSSWDFDEIRSMIESSQAPIIVLENTRFHPGEKSNEEEFSKQLASLATNYVSDAFGAVHRAHASTVGVTRFIPGYAGMLVEREVKRITQLRDNPSSPSVAIFGGAKISTKLELLQNFVGRVDTIILGGGMANTFLKAQGYAIGNSLFEEDMLETARAVLSDSAKAGQSLLIPSDVRLAKSFDSPWMEDGQTKSTGASQIPDDAMVLDIGPTTERDFSEAIGTANSIIWNGPMGVFEKEEYRSGTMQLARSVLNRKANTVIGGGETAYAMNLLGAEIPSEIHISTGGGASLELMSGRELPGVACLSGRVE